MASKFTFPPAEEHMARRPDNDSITRGSPIISTAALLGDDDNIAFRKR